MEDDEILDDNPSYLDLMPPTMLSRRRSFNEIIHYVWRVIEKIVVIPQEDHARMLNALSSISNSSERISDHEIRQRVAVAFAKVEVRDYSPNPGEQEWFDAICAQLPSPEQ